MMDIAVSIAEDRATKTTTLITAINIIASVAMAAYLALESQLTGANIIFLFIGAFMSSMISIFSFFVVIALMFENIYNKAFKFSALLEMKKTIEEQSITIEKLQRENKKLYLQLNQ